MKDEKGNCKHEYNLSKYDRDDQGFYLNCVHCNAPAFFECNTLEELYELFGVTDDED